MQGDLISRKVVMEYLQEQQANVIIEKNKSGFVSQEVCAGMLSAVDAFINFIVQCPIDYNVEKVVAKLEEEKSDWNDDYNVPITKAIEIVRNGGKE